MQIPVTQQPLTPPGTSGFYDIPFIYAINYLIPKSGAGSNPGIDGGGFFAGQWQDIIQSQGDYEFRLRRHIPSWPRNFNLLDSGRYALYSPYDFNPKDVNPGANMRADVIISPDLIYPPGAGIPVYNSAGNQFLGLDSVWYGFYYMQGVKRIYKAPNLQPAYPYQERQFFYPLTVTMTTTLAVTRYIILVQNYDFELQALDYYAGFGTSLPNEPTTMQLQVYDSGRYSMMSDFVDIAVLQTGNDNVKPGPAGCFPTPPVLYPRGSQIIVDVRCTQLTANLPETQTINFRGVNRVPCG